ncbi:hypothetical protein Chor_014713, partial [Crotalus horridus]
MEGDFQFLLCARCQREARNPKLLACLHTLCSECLEENKPVGQCPVCAIPIQTSQRFPLQDNLLFINLQAKLNTYQKIVRNQELLCNLCKGGAEFWCVKCEEFLCLKCYEAHQWYMKQKSHETQRLADLRNETAQSFLEGARKTCNLIYCRGCHKPMCCSCALLDGEHYNAKLYSDIRVEIESRKEELSKVKMELVEKKRNYESTYHKVQERLQKLEKVRNETRELIQKKVKDMVQWIQHKGEELVEKVDRRLCLEQDEAKKKLESTEQFLKRMEAGEQLVEKMDLFASDQEVMDMQPFIKDSLERLKKEKLPASSFRIQVENFDEVKGELQDLLRRVRGEDAFGCTVSTPGSCCSLVNSDSLHNEKTPPRSQGVKTQRPTYTVSVAKTPQGFTTSITSPGAKRPITQLEKSIQASPKLMKLEEHECSAREVSSKQVQEKVLRSPPLNRESTPEPEQKEGAKLFGPREDSPAGICES